jgi:hypothetical protein
MLVSAIITKAQNLVNNTNTSFWTTTEQLQDAQLAWKQIYAFLLSNNDDYFLSKLYINPTSNIYVNQSGDLFRPQIYILNILTAATANGTITLQLNGQTAVTTAVLLGDSATVVAGKIVASGYTGYTLANTGGLITITATTNGYQSGISSFSPGASGVTASTNFTADAYRMYAYTFPLPLDFMAVRLFQYQGTSGNRYYPMYKNTILEYGNTSNSPGYREVGPNLEIFDPYGMTSFCLWYYPQPITLLTTTDLVYPNNVMPEIMAYMIAAEIRRKAHLDAALWEKKRDDLMLSMITQASRDDGRGVSPNNVFANSMNIWS